MIEGNIGALSSALHMVEINYQFAIFNQPEIEFTLNTSDATTD